MCFFKRELWCFYILMRFYVLLCYGLMCYIYFTAILSPLFKFTVQHFGNLVVFKMCLIN